MSKRKIAVFGADGRVGLAVVKETLSRDWDVNTITNSGNNALPGDMKTIECDVLKDDVTPTLKGCDAVVSCLGVGNDPQTLLNPPPLYTEETTGIVHAMQESGIDCLAVVSASFVETLDRGPVSFRAVLPGLSHIFAQMSDREPMLADIQGLRWTAARAGWVLDATASAKALVTPDVIPKNLIRSRTGDIAKLMVDCIASGEWIGDPPAVASPEDNEDTSVKAVATEVV